MIKQAMLIALCLAIGAVRAQNCPTGIPSAGNPGCIPPSHSNSPYYQGAQPGAAPVDVWEDRWGAVAVDYSNGAFGTASNARNKEQARKAAIKRCADNGGGAGACAESVVEYRNKCGIVVESADFTVLFTGEDKAKTSLDALWACDQRSEHQCSILFAECSYPVSVRIR